MTANGSPLSVSITQEGTESNPTLNVLLEGRKKLADEERRGVSDALKRMLGTDVDLSEFYAMAARDDKLARLAEDFRGLKPPRFPTLFEALVNAVACQQLSLAVCIMLTNRLAEACGSFVQTADGPVYAFPGPADVLKMGVDDLRVLGFSRQKGTYLLELARAVSTSRRDEAAPGRVQTLAEPALEGLDELESRQALERLLTLRGIGRWSAEYVLLRGLGRLSLFPGDDVGARKKLADWLDLPGKLTYENVGSVTSRWGRFAGFVYFHLLLKDLKEHGHLEPG